MRILKLGLLLIAAVCIVVTPFYLGIFSNDSENASRASGAAVTLAPINTLVPQVTSVSERQSAVVAEAVVRVDTPELPPANGYLARVLLDSPEDVKKALLRAEELYARGDVSGGEEPLAFVLHGPEVQIFFKGNYQRYKTIVDLAAKLSAFKVVDVRVCETRVSVLGETPEALPPFVETVPYGPAEIDRLVVEKQYVYF